MFRSRDVGETWERIDIGDVPPSRMYGVTIERANPSHLHCCSSLGQVYSSQDEGDTWTKSELARRVVPLPGTYTPWCPARRAFRHVGVRLGGRFQAVEITRHWIPAPFPRQSRVPLPVVPA